MDNDVLTRDSDMNLSVRTVSSSGDNYVDPNDVYTRDSDGKLAVRVVGSGGGSIDENRIIVKSDTIPTAGSDNLGKFYCYSGVTNATYTHGYIYECVAGSVSYEANFAYEKSTFASEDFYKAGQLLVDAGVQDPTLVTAGTMTYALAGNLWSIVFTDEDGNALNEAYNIYTDDLEQDYDIIPVIDPSEFTDGQVVHIAINNVIEHLGDFSWQRIDVQPNFQYATMPSATIENGGKIVQYIGETNASYTHGYIYECVVTHVDEVFTPTAVNCSAIVQLDDLKEIWGTTTDWIHVFTYDSDSQNWYLDGGDTPVQLSDYGISAPSVNAGASITCDYKHAYDVITWQQLNVQPTPVTSVNGSTGAVTITAADLGATTASTAVKTLNSANWSNNEQSVYVYGVTASNVVIVSPAPASQADYVAAGIYCSAQANESLTFTCAITPTSNISVNVLILG